jgi:hypothetical protein
MPRLSFDDDQLNSQSQLDSDRRYERDAREPRAHLRRVVTDADRRESLALNFASSFTKVVES